MIRRLLVPVAAVALLAATVPFTATSNAAGTGAPTSAPTTVGAATVFTACYSRKSGEIRMLTRKRCPKGWKKIRWNATGPVGPQGPVGPAGPAGAVGPARSVVDATGRVLGTLIGMHGTWLIPAFYVQDAEGALWTYYGNGSLVGEGNEEVRYLDATCGGQPYALVKAGMESGVGGPGRAVVSVNNVATAAYRTVSGLTPATGVPLWWRNYSGVCASWETPTSGSLTELVAVPLPSNALGPLRIT